LKRNWWQTTEIFGSVLCVDWNDLDRWTLNYHNLLTHKSLLIKSKSKSKAKWAKSSPNGQSRPFYNITCQQVETRQ